MKWTLLWDDIKADVDRIDKRVDLAWKFEQA